MIGIPLSPQRWTRMQLLLLLVIAFAGIVYAATLKSNLSFSDEFDYASIAANLRHAHVFSLDGINPTATRPPGYPWLLVLFHGVRLAKAVNIVFWFVSVVATASLTRRFFGQTASTASLVISLLYVVELYTAGTLFPQAFASALFLCSFWLHFAWKDSGALVESLVQACLWSLLVLTVPLFVINFALFLVWVLWKRRKLLQVALMAAIVCLSISAWSFRNQKTFHSFFLSDNSGLMLILGNSDATGPNTGPTLPLETMAPSVWAQKDEFARDNGYKRLAVDWIHAHPRRAATLYVEKTLNWFGCGTNLKTSSRDQGAYRYLIGGVYYPILLAALASFFFLPGFRDVEAYFAAQYLSAACAYAVFFTRVRYRLPYDYLLIILAAATLAQLARLLKRTGGGAAFLFPVKHEHQETTRSLAVYHRRVES